MVTDQEREDVSTTSSDGDVSPLWLKVRRSKKKAMMTEEQEMLDLDAVHAQRQRGEDHDHKLSSSISHAQGHAPKHAEERERLENKSYRVAGGSKTA